MEIEIRECTRVEELADCVELQREVFALPDIEISPVRHLIVTKNAGGFTLGAFAGGRLVGFVLSIPAFLRGEMAFYSHMTAVKKDFQSFGIGARLKWAQRERSLKEGIKYIKWTFQPVQARNAHFNLEKLGAEVRHYAPNFYGTDYPAPNKDGKGPGIDSDRLFAEWHLEGEKTVALSQGNSYDEPLEVKYRLEITPDWNTLLSKDPHEAMMHQKRIKEEFFEAFANGLVCRGFIRDEGHPAYLFY